MKTIMIFTTKNYRDESNRMVVGEVANNNNVEYYSIVIFLYNS